MDLVDEQQRSVGAEAELVLGVRQEQARLGRDLLPPGEHGQPRRHHPLPELRLDESPLDDPVHCPIAHGEGRYVHPDPIALAAAGQVALRYTGPNPNGSVADIAGVCDASGVVLGLMPHPENHVIPRQHPRHRHDSGTVRHLGLRLFEAAVRHVK